MIYKDFNINYDKEKIVEEVLECKDLFFEIPPYDYWIDLAKRNKVFMVESKENYDRITFQNSKGIIKNALEAPKSFYIKSIDFKNKSYAESKKSIEGISIYNPKIANRLQYTKHVIENLPFETINLVRVFITENTFLPTHHDRLLYSQKSGIGLSLVPIHSNSPLMYYDPREKKINSIFSSSFLFDDSYLHGIPIVDGLRIDIRVFGNLKKEYT